MEGHCRAPQRSRNCAALKDLLDWFKRQLFGRHSEKRLEYDLTEQASLFEALGVEDAPAPEVPTEEISYRRRRKSRGAAVNDSGLRFDESMPVTNTEVEDPAVRRPSRCGPGDPRSPLGPWVPPDP